MSKTRPNLPPMPERIARLPIDPERGYPVPYFVQWFDDKPDFRIVDSRSLVKCVNMRLCWICGEPMGVRMIFVVGCMCVVNRVSAEPPSHLDCAEFAIKACPFLTMPKMVRRENDLPPDMQAPAGMFLERNPAVSALWTTRQYTMELQESKPLFFMGEPERVAFYREGRRATRAEILESINTGFPLLTDKLSPANLKQLEQERDEAIALFVPEA